MTEPPESSVPAMPAAVASPPKTPEQMAKAARAGRLAKALRDNLKRRKAVQPRPDRLGN